MSRYARERDRAIPYFRSRRVTTSDPSARCASSHIRRAWPTIGGAAAALLRWMKSGAEPSGMKEQLSAMDRAGK